MATIRGLLVAAALAATAGGVASCDACAGTPSCHGYPEVNYGAQFIQRRTGNVVPGVHVRFVRSSGPEMVSDTVTALSDAEGFIQLRGLAYSAGFVVGRLEVTPPAPHAPYTVDPFTLRTNQTRGEGNVGGRLVVDPYAYVIAEVFDRRTNLPVPNAEVSLDLQPGGVATGPQAVNAVTDELGRVLFEPTVTTWGRITYAAVVRIPGDTATYRFPFVITTDYQDRVPYPILMKVPRLVNYTLEASRRGTGEFLPGVTMQFVRTGGIRVQPETISGPAVNGRFIIDPTPLEDGVLFGDITITPPAPFQLETLKNVRLETDYRDTLKLIGIFGYGPQVFMRAHLRNRWNDSLVRRGTNGIVKRVGGLPFVYPPGANPAADSGIRLVDTLGRLPFIAATADTGEVRLDISVRFPGFLTETFPNVAVRARDDSVANDLGPWRVGPWYPWYVEVRDASNGALVTGARVEFQRVSGPAMRPEAYVAFTGTDGRFRVRSEPLAPGTVTGTLKITVASGLYRDTTIAGLQLPSAQHDTLRLVRAVLLERR